MDTKDIYMSLPYDLSGATSKNRFRFEILWGAYKMFDLYDLEDFCVIFDYKCDIEIHLNKSIEFYQIKTHKIQSPTSFTSLSKKDKTGKSILGKLFVLKNAGKNSSQIKVALVSNTFFKLGNKTFSEAVELPFSDLDDKSQQKIIDVMQKEVGNDISLENISYIYTSINLSQPQNDLMGKIIYSFNKIKNCDPSKPTALYRLIVDTIEQKACYEFNPSSYNELVEKKGITKAQLNNMLDKYVTGIDNSVEKVSKYIENTHTKLKERKNLKVALVRVIELLSKSKEMQLKEQQIVDFLFANIDDLPDYTDNIIDFLLSNFKNTFSIEYSDNEIYVFLLLILFKWEDGKYE